MVDARLDSGHCALPRIAQPPLPYPYQGKAPVRDPKVCLLNLMEAKPKFAALWRRLQDSSPSTVFPGGHSKGRRGVWATLTID